MNNFKKTLNKHDFSKLHDKIAKKFMEQFKKINFKKYKNIDFKKSKIHTNLKEPEWLIDITIMNKNNFGFQVIIENFEIKERAQINIYFTEFPFVSFEEFYTAQEAINFLKDQFNNGTKIKKIYWQDENELKGIDLWDRKKQKYNFLGYIYNKPLWQHLLFWKPQKKDYEIKKEMIIKWK